MYYTVIVKLLVAIEETSTNSSFTHSYSLMVAMEQGQLER